MTPQTTMNIIPIIRLFVFFLRSFLINSLNKSQIIKANKKTNGIMILIGDIILKTVLREKLLSLKKFYKFFISPFISSLKKNISFIPGHPISQA